MASINFLLESGEIAGIVSGATALIGAIATFIYKVRGRGWREVVKDIMGMKTEEVKELAKVVQEQSKVAKTIIEKELDKKNKKK